VRAAFGDLAQHDRQKELVLDERRLAAIAVDLVGRRAGRRRVACRRSAAGEMPRGSVR
jgi:hypothetical protein